MLIRCNMNPIVVVKSKFKIDDINKVVIETDRHYYSHQDDTPFYNNAILSVMEKNKVKNIFIDPMDEVRKTKRDVYHNWMDVRFNPTCVMVYTGINGLNICDDSKFYYSVSRLGNYPDLWFDNDGNPIKYTSGSYSYINSGVNIITDIENNYNTFNSIRVPIYRVIKNGFECYYVLNSMVDFSKCVFLRFRDREFGSGKLLSIYNILWKDVFKFEL